MKNLRGFTIIELMVATSLLGLIMVFLINTYLTTSKLSQRSIAKGSINQEARTVLDILSHDLKVALLSSRFLGEHRVIQVEGNRAISADIIRFLTTQKVFNLGGEGPQVYAPREVTYTLENLKEGGLQLIRQIQPPESSKSLPNRVVLSHQVKELRFRYRGNDGWHDQWAEKKPPIAIELSVTFQDRQGTTTPLSLSSLVSLGSR